MKRNILEMPKGGWLTEKSRVLNYLADEIKREKVDREIFPWVKIFMGFKDLTPTASCSGHGNTGFIWFQCTRERALDLWNALTKAYTETYGDYEDKGSLRTEFFTTWNGSRIHRQFRVWFRTESRDACLEALRVNLEREGFESGDDLGPIEDIDSVAISMYDIRGKARGRVSAVEKFEKFKGTETRRTVKELREFLSLFSEDCDVWGYEGEGVGIIVSNNFNESGFFDNSNSSRDEVDIDTLELKGAEVYRR